MSNARTSTRRSTPRPALAAASRVVLMGALLVSPPGGEDGDPTPSRTTFGACIATGPRSSVEEINDFVASAEGVPEFVGADIGVDVRLGAGRSIWFFGDTLQGSPTGAPFVRNSMLYFRPGCVQVVRPPGGGALVPDRADGIGYWPMSAWRTFHGATETIHVMLQRVEDTPDSTGAIVTLGPALATFRVPREGPPELVDRRDLGADDPSPAAVAWGAASAVAGQWLYVYGTSTRPLPGIHGFALRVARVGLHDVGDLSRWRYWDGQGWQPDPGAATALLAEQGGVSQTLSVWHQDGRWYVLSKQDEFLGRQVVVWPGPSPVGPFATAHTVADLPCDSLTGELRYMPLAHPGLLPEAGSVVVSYSRNYADFRRVCAAPKSYRPYFIRVALPD